MKKTVWICLCLVLFGCNMQENAINNSVVKKALPDNVRVQKMLDLKWGLFLHWSLGTISGEEWTFNMHSPDSFKVSGLDTDQWCKAAKDAGMGYIIFVVKHPDGFCLWDTKTTDFKVTNSPLGRDALAELRKSCDKYDLELCLYFAEGEWFWDQWENPEVKAAQLRELFTEYGNIPLIWLDVAVWDGGLGHDETTKLIKDLQPNCFIGYNHGLPSGDLQSREMGNFDVLETKREPGFLSQEEIDSLVKWNEMFVRILDWEQAAEQEEVLRENYGGFLLAENSVCINQTEEKWYWFYNEETKNNAISASKIYDMYKTAIESKVIFSLALGPNKEGKLREVDIQRLKEVGKMIKEE